jgi:thiol-disulfide isomerase/thioredoxin
MQWKSAGMLVRDHLLVAALGTSIAGCSPHRDYAAVADSALPIDDTAPVVDDTSSADTALPYPDGPYGVGVGQVFPNAHFQGYLDGTGPWRTDLSMADYYDPTAQRLHVVMVDTAAMWCPPCKEMAKALPGFHAQFRPRGAEFVSLIMEGKLAKRRATKENVDDWLETYALPFTTGIDPDQVVVVSDPTKVAYPTEFFIDVRTMIVIRTKAGYEPDRPYLLAREIEAALVATGVEPDPEAGVAPPPDAASDTAIDPVTDSSDAD